MQRSVAIGGQMRLVVVVTTLLVALSTSCLGEATVPNENNSFDEYCAMQCFDTDMIHTLCKRRGCPLSCKATTNRITSEDRSVLLRTINSHRQRVATGALADHPKASSMRKLIWLEEIAAFAQCHANDCKFVHDQCRDTMDFPVGQVVSRQLGSISNGIMVQVKKWIRSGLETPFSLNFTGDESAATMAYLQLIWGNTQFIGCGITKFVNDTEPVTLLVCNLGPAGLLVGNNVYRPGPSCSACPENYACSSRFTGLCTNDFDDVDVKGHANSLHGRHQLTSWVLIFKYVLFNFMWISL